MIFNYYFCLEYKGYLDRTLDDNNIFWIGIEEAITHQNNSPNPIDALTNILEYLRDNPDLGIFVPKYIEETQVIKKL